MHELAGAVTLTRVQAATTWTEWPPRVSVLLRVADVTSHGLMSHKAL